MISSVYGGMATTNSDQVAQQLRKAQADFGMPNVFWTLQQILHPILMYCIVLPLYKFLDLGKIFLIISQWLHVLSKAVSWQEKRGQKPDYFPKALPNALAAMAWHQFKKLETFNINREKMAEFYYNELVGGAFGLPPKDQKGRSIFLRFSVTHPKAHEIIYEAWHKENILLGDWYTSVIAPWDTRLDKMAYKLGFCKNAENLAQKTLNLPTHINVSMEDAQRVVTFLKKWK